MVPRSKQPPSNANSAGRFVYQGVAHTAFIRQRRVGWQRFTGFRDMSETPDKNSVVGRVPPAYNLTARIPL